MNRLEASPYCRICGIDLRERLNATELILLRADFARMIVNGMCDNCQSDRLKAAIEYEAAVNEVALVTRMGAKWSRSKPPVIHPALLQARKRLRAADAWCVRLKMWPEGRERNAHDHHSDH